MLDFEVQLASAWPRESWQSVTILAAVSGGADSVALLRALAAAQIVARETSSSLPGRLIVAHFNHALRGAESDADQQFVVTLAERLGLACQTGRAAGQSSCSPADAGAGDTDRSPPSTERCHRGVCQARNNRARHDTIS